MTCAKRRFLLGTLLCLFCHALLLQAALMPVDGGQAVYDSTMNVVWAADANLAKSMTFGLPIFSDGSMTYKTAVKWVSDLNSMPGGGYLGHSNWTLPTSPMIDTTCSAVGPNGNSFGIGCTGSPMGNLFYNANSLNLKYPNTAVPIPPNSFGPFKNFQPYLYWSDTAHSNLGFNTFSFNTGWDGANVDFHYIYALPMIPHQISQPGVTYSPTGFGSLEISSDGKTIWDPLNQVTWAANADLAMTNHFGAQCTKPNGTLCINPDGSMSHTTAENWVQGMNNFQYAGQMDWQLPPVPDGDTTCSVLPSTGFNCTGNPLANLFYQQLGLSAGNSPVTTPDINVGPFTDIQPYLYWSCQSEVVYPCTSQIPGTGMEWSFSFGNGFEGTDDDHNALYVMVYYPVPEPTTLSLLGLGAAAMLRRWRMKR